METGFKELDELFEIKNGELIIVASRPAVGKSTFVQNILTNAVLKRNISAILFNLESSKYRIASRIISSVSDKKIRVLETDKNMDEEDNYGYYLNILDEEDFLEDIDDLENKKIYIDDTPGISIEEIRQKCRELKLSVDIGLIVIDYLQLLTLEKGNKEEVDRNEVIRNLKIIAKEINVPVIVTSQLSRKVDERKNRDIYMDDLAESKVGVLRYSDKIIFLQKGDEQDSNITNIIVAMNNNGKIGAIKLSLLGECGKFVDFDKKM